MNRSESRKKAAHQRRQAIRSKQFTTERGSQPVFVADVMLGRLARWLRIAGFDVLYSNRFTDDELVALSRQQRRILLSRDTRLLVRRGVDRFIFLESEKIQDQLAQVFRVTQTVKLPGILTRCLTCNDVLIEIPHEMVRARVPPFVYQSQAQFKGCPKCNRIYWPGTHRDSVLRILENLIRVEPEGSRSPL